MIEFLLITLRSIVHAIRILFPFILLGLAVWLVIRLLWRR